MSKWRVSIRSVHYKDVLVEAETAEEAMAKIGAPDHTRVLDDEDVNWDIFDERWERELPREEWDVEAWDGEEP